VAVDSGGFRSVPTFELPLWVMKVFVTAVILSFPVELILDVRTDAITETDFGKTVQPSFISLVDILALPAVAAWRRVVSPSFASSVEVPMLAVIRQMPVGEPPAPEATDEPGTSATASARGQQITRKSIDAVMTLRIKALQTTKKFPRTVRSSTH
jgi:hypothetical protein